MKSFLIAAAAGLLVAGTASAQPAWDAGRFWRGAPESPNERVTFLQTRVDRSIADGSLDRAEGKRVTRELEGVRAWLRDMHMEEGRHLSHDQRAQAQARLDDISRQIRWLRQTGW